MPRTSPPRAVVTVRTDAAGGPVELLAFPNPATDYVSLQSTASTSPTDVTLTDVTGRTVRTWQTALDGNDRLYLDGVPAGVYALRIQATGATTFLSIQR